ncbi:MAG: ammonium transporter [Hydrogenophaga sp.]|uniref:ammonium transporter n=1 Tax=Hydrogenophaga sp. TaxID=1904254 RepID=UPI00403759B8
MHQNRVAPARSPSKPPRKHSFSSPLIALLLSPLAALAQTAPAAAPEPAATAALTAPGLVAASAIQGADTAWLMVSTALVLLMTLPGIALFYGGMVRRINVINTLASVVGIAAVVSVLWFALAYSLAFTPGGALGGFIGGASRMGFSGMEYLAASGQVAVSHIAQHVPESVFAMFQLTFAIITCALVVGALVERMHFGALLLFAGLWLLLVYAPIAHWVWEPGGWLAQLGALDFAGGAVVHINAGAAALVCAYALGPRAGYGREPFVPFNLGLTMAGTGLLWVGWFGFNAGSALAADGRAGLALLVTHVAAASGAIAWMGAEWFSRKRASLLGLCSGVVAGLVAITPAAGFVTPRSALVIGLVAGVACYWGATALKRKLRADDSLDVFGVHGVGGLVGAVLTGVLADPAISGVESSVVAQLIACVAVLAYSLVMTAVVLWLTSRFATLRVREGEERAGLDVSLHNESVG